MDNKEERIKSALDEASDRFWATVAKNFPEAKYRDFPPDMAFELSKIMEKSIRVWIDSNVTQE